jgi:hypothetical protein
MFFGKINYNYLKNYFINSNLEKLIKAINTDNIRLFINHLAL